MAKLSGAKVDSVLRRPPESLIVALIYGPDSGLVRERAETAMRAVAGSLDDPFRTAVLATAEVAKDPARLADEAQAQSLMGGRRAVRIRDGADSLAKPLQALLDQPPSGTLLVVEAGNLGPGSKLRSLCEKHDAAVACPCYDPGPEDIAALAGSIVGAAKLRLDPEAEAYIAANLVADRQLARRELEKLVQYAGTESPITLAMAQAVIGDNAEQSMDDLALAVGDGDLPQVDRMLEKLWAEGVSPVPVLRAVARHFDRLHACGARVATGMPTVEALKALRPPVFFKVRDRFTRQVGRWPAEACATALDRLRETEAQCKRTGMPDTVLAGRTLFQIAVMGKRAGRS